MQAKNISFNKNLTLELYSYSNTAPFPLSPVLYSLNITFKLRCFFTVTRQATVLNSIAKAYVVSSMKSKIEIMNH